MKDRRLDALAADIERSLDERMQRLGWRPHRRMYARDLGGDVCGWASMSASPRPEDQRVWVLCNVGALSPRIGAWKHEVLPPSGEKHSFHPSIVRALVTFESTRRSVFVVRSEGERDAVLDAMTGLLAGPVQRWLDAHADHERLASELASHTIDRRIRHGCMASYFAHGPGAAASMLDGVERELAAKRTELGEAWSAILLNEIRAVAAALVTGPSPSAQKSAVAELGRVRRLTQPRGPRPR